MASMFDIAGLLNPTALNRLLQPIQSPQGVQNFLANPQAAPQLPAPVDVPMQQVAAAPQADPWAGMREQDVVSIDPMTTSAMPEQPKPFGQKYQDFINSDRGQFLNDVFTGWAAGSTPQESIAYGAKLSAGGRRDRQNVNQTVEWLKGKGLDEASARQIAGSPPALNEYLKSLMGGGKSNLINAGGSLYDPSTGEWITPPAGASRPTEFGLNLIYGKDAAGNTVAYQLSKDGSYKPFEPPEGVTLTPGISEINTGTGTRLINSKTGEYVGDIAKDVAGQSAQEVVGKATGDAQAAIPAAEETAKMVSRQIEELKTDPYLDRMVGPVDSMLPNVSADAARVQGRMNQLQGGAFLQARALLKGGGAITDFEGAKAEDAYARLQTAQSEADYRQALDDFNEAVQIGLRKLYRQAGQQPAPAAPGPQNIDDLVKKYGG